MPHLIFIYGPPLSGKTSLARSVADGLDGKSAVLSLDSLLHDAIRNHDLDAVQEMDVVHTQARLLLANYLKSRYHVVLEGAFCYLRDGVMHHREQEIDQNAALMRNMATSPLIVRLKLGDASLADRAVQAGRDTAEAQAVSAQIRPRYGERALELDADGSLAELADIVLERLETP